MASYNKSTSLLLFSVFLILLVGQGTIFLFISLYLLKIEKFQMFNWKVMSTDDSTPTTETATDSTQSSTTNIPSSTATPSSTTTEANGACQTSAHFFLITTALTLITNVIYRN